MGVYSLQSTCLLLMIQIQKLDRFIGAGQFVLYFFHILIMCLVIVRILS
jgi:hypothetical protein